MRLITSRSGVLIGWPFWRLQVILVSNGDGLLSDMTELNITSLTSGSCETAWDSDGVAIWLIGGVDWLGMHWS